MSAQCENIYRGIGNLGDLLGSEAERHTHPITRVGKIYPAWPLARLYAATGRRRPSFCPRAARGGGPPRRVNYTGSGSGCARGASTRCAMSDDREMTCLRLWQECVMQYPQTRQLDGRCEQQRTMTGIDENIITATPTQHTHNSFTHEPPRSRARARLEHETCLLLSSACSDCGRRLLNP